MHSKYHFKSSKDSWWISPVLILLGIISILLGWKQQQQSGQLRKRGICTTATVLRVIASDPGYVDAEGMRIRVGSARKYASKKYVPLLRFTTVNGQEQDAWGSRANNDYKNLRPGDKLQIVYSPNSPDEIEILDETEEKNNTCVMIVGGIFILAGLFTFRSCIRKKAAIHKISMGDFPSSSLEQRVGD